jgi:NDP-sugar pyrophosphorylase family protein
VDALALIMAGGSGERMRMSGGEVPKPLVPVRGVPLLERSLHAVLRAGFTDIVISVPHSVPVIGEFAISRCAAIAEAAGARVSLIDETVPLGNIGCAGLLAARASTVMVVYADNLTTLDLPAVVGHHLDIGASLTLTTHLERYRIPYGELVIEGGEVLEYREKPEHAVLICSAISVLGPAALTALQRNAPMGLVDLFYAMKAEGRLVADFRHHDPWIDVNDRRRLDDAERLLAAHALPFECWCASPARTIDVALITRGDLLLLRRDPDGGGRPLGWTLPPVDSLNIADLEATKLEPIAEFDDLSDSGTIARYRVFRHSVRAVSAPEAPNAWVARVEVDVANATSPLVRALAVST